MSDLNMTARDDTFGPNGIDLIWYILDPTELLPPSYKDQILTSGGGVESTNPEFGQSTDLGAD